MNFKKSMGREVSLLVNERDLQDLLEDAFNELSKGKRWVEKGDSKVVLEALKKSCQHPGKYIILTCAHCEIPSDILLNEFEVIIDEDYVYWRVKPPGADFYFDEYEILEFKFNKSQYELTVDNLIRKN